MPDVSAESKRVPLLDAIQEEVLRRFPLLQLLEFSHQPQASPVRLPYFIGLLATVLETADRPCCIVLPDSKGVAIGVSTLIAITRIDLPADTSPVMPNLSPSPSDVPNAVDKLRAKAETASKLMINFIAKQCLVQGTQKPICHELSMRDGKQTFRRIVNNGHLDRATSTFPILKHGVWAQSDWGDALGEIADNPWVFQGSVGDRFLFTFESDAKDDRCYHEEYSQGTPLFGGAHPNWKGPVACFEEVLTDKDFNVLSTFTELHPPDDCLIKIIQMAIYYEWITLEGLKAPVLLPVKEMISAKVLGQKELLYTTVSWSDYKQFRADHRVEFGVQASSHQLLIGPPIPDTE